MAAEYDPHWPFPQYDENGKQLLPPPPPRRKKHLELEDIEDAPM
jgi:hypothetical protein